MPTQSLVYGVNRIGDSKVPYCKEPVEVDLGEDRAFWKCTDKKSNNPNDDSGVNIIAEEFEGQEMRLDSIEGR